MSRLYLLSIAAAYCKSLLRDPWYVRGTHKGRLSHRPIFLTSNYPIYFKLRGLVGSWKIFTVLFYESSTIQGRNSCINWIYTLKFFIGCRIVLLYKLHVNTIIIKYLFCLHFTINPGSILTSLWYKKQKSSFFRKRNSCTVLLL